MLLVTSLTQSGLHAPPKARHALEDQPSAFHGTICWRIARFCRSAVHNTNCSSACYLRAIHSEETGQRTDVAPWGPSTGARTVTGLFTGCTLDSSTSISITCKVNFVAIWLKRGVHCSAGIRQAAHVFAQHFELVLRQAVAVPQFLYPRVKIWASAR
jgi:hypothetical protein